MKYGLVCRSEVLKDQKITFRAMTRKTFLSMPRDKAVEKLSSIILHNCGVLGKTIQHCADSGIWHYRVSCSLMPLLTDVSLSLNLKDLPDYRDIVNKLANVGELADELGISLSSHPDTYNVLPSYKPEVVVNTIRELDFQSEVLDMLGLPQDLSSSMCLHLAASPKNETPKGFAKRFKAGFDLCSEGVRRRLCLENEHNGFWTAANLLKYFPDDTLIFDNLHNRCNGYDGDAPEYIERFAETWKGYTPVFHFSEGTVEKPRSHAEYCSSVPRYILDNSRMVWEVELKAKDKAILQILES